MDDLEQKTENQEPEIKVSDYIKKFKASEKVMRDDFLPKYELANARVRAELEIKGKGTRKLTHEQVAITYSIGSNFVNSVYFKSPNVNLTAREEVEHQQIENTETAVNDWIQDTKASKVIKRSIWDAFKGGFGAVFVDYEYDDVEDPNQIISPAVIDPVTQQELQPAKLGRMVLRNDITIQRIRPDLVRFPRGFDMGNYYDSPWIGFDVIVPIDDVKNNTNYDETVRLKIEGEKYDKLSSSRETNAKAQKDDQDLYAKISYCFIKPQFPKFQPFKLLIFCQKYEESPLQTIEFNKGHVGYPLHFIYFNPLDDDNSYPCGDAWMFESQLNAIDEWWKKVFRHIKRSNPKFVYDQSAIDQQEANKLKSNNDNEFVGLKNKQQKDLRSLFSDLQSPPVPVDLDKLWKVSRELISEIAPKSSISGGAAGQTNTATEAKMVASGEMIDIDARIDDVRNFIKAIVLDVAGILENSLVDPIPLKRELEDGSEQFEQVGSEGFTSKINADVDVESMQAQNKDVVRRQLIDMLGLFEKLAPLFNAIGEMPDPKWWIERIMETSNIRNIEKGFKPVQMLQPMPPSAPDQKQSVNNTVSGDMPQEAVEAGVGQRV